MSTTTAPFRPTSTDSGHLVHRRTALVVVGCACVLAAYQVALAAGAPLGRAAWGGDHSTLPDTLRIASVFPIVVYGLGSVVVLRRAGYRLAWVPPRVAHRGTVVFGVVLLLSALVNFASHSPWERFLMAPVALSLGLLTLWLARGPGIARQGP